jgi:hypothetical protein
MKDVREAFERARLDPGEIDRALTIVDSFLAANRECLVTTAYLGSLHGMKAGAAILPWIKLKYVKVASELLDNAYERRSDAAKLALDGDEVSGDLEILLLRGIAYANFPSFLGHRDAARSSLEEAIGHPGFPRVPATYWALAFAHLAALCRAAAEERAAHRFLQRAREADRVTTELVWKGQGFE